MWLLKENPKRGARVKYQPLNYKIKLQNIHIYIYKFVFCFLSRTYFVERSTQLIEEHQYNFTEVQVSRVIILSTLEKKK